MSGHSTETVETTAGRIRGVMIEGVSAFKSVPYGASTAGANRFRPPQPVPPWTGIHDTTATTGQAPQWRGGPATRPELADFSGPPDSSPQTEDCLTLNVWSANLHQGTPRPVMVWFHGGAFSFGSSNAERLRGSRLARRGNVVVVTVNQRLNIFGHLHLGEHAPGFAESGNAGTLDMVAALHWVRDNIGVFGGDPGCVTIFGESGGGGKVSTLMAMPMARGLFHRAIVQSGAVVRLRTRERAARLTDAVLAELGLAGAPIETLQAVPMPHLIAAIAPAEKALGPSATPLFDRYPFGPMVDGDIVPHHPFDPAAPAISADIPLMIGDMKDEITSFLAHDDTFWHRTLTEAELRKRVAAVAGPHTDRVIETYRHNDPNGSPTDRLIATLTDSNFRIRSLVLAQRKAAQAAPVFMYSFEWETPRFDGRLKAPHALDVPFTFDTIDLTHATDGSATANTLAATMAETWARFAHTGSPAHPAIPVWPRYDLANRPTMMLDANWRVENDPRGEGRRLWQDITGI